MTSVNKLGLSGKVDDFLSYSLAGEPKRLEHCFGAGFTKCREQNMLRSHSLGLQCPGLHCRLVYDPPAFFREGDLIELLLWVATTTDRFERPASLRDVQPKRIQDRDDPALAIACACAQNAEHQMFRAYRAVVEDARRFVLCQSEHTLRVVVV